MLSKELKQKNTLLKLKSLLSDHIDQYFIAENLEQTGRNIFDFLKAHVPYFIESNEFQYFKSPASIVSTKGDCKSFALFSCGILDAFARNENPDLQVSYRFASYDPYNKTPEHVFCVVKEYGKEYWIDPVLDRFNQRKDPYFYKDKKLNTMALVGLSGIDNTYQNDQIGSIDWTNLLSSVLQNAPNIINATSGKGVPVYGGGQPMPSNIPVQTTSSGINTQTMLLIGVGAVALILLLKK
jgi:hypothetical protein